MSAAPVGGNERGVYRVTGPGVDGVEFDEDGVRPYAEDGEPLPGFTIEELVKPKWLIEAEAREATEAEERSAKAREAAAAEQERARERLARRKRSKCPGCGLFSNVLPADDGSWYYEAHPGRFGRDACSGSNEPWVDPVDAELEKRAVKHEADRRERASTRRAMPEPMSLAKRFELPYVPADWRINGWQLVGQRVGVNAQWKSGKTTAMVNLATCLADERPWLGRYEVKRPEGAIAILDFEMAETGRAGVLDEWYRVAGLKHTDQVLLWGMRGQARAFDLMDDDVMRHWLDVFKHHGVGYVILDCLRPVLDAAGLNEHTEAGALLVRFDALLDEAGIREAVLVQHMGHMKGDGSTAGRARGDSRLMDWPDVTWTLEREKPNDPRSKRSMGAYGRGVDVERVGVVLHEGRLREVAPGEEPEPDRANVEAREDLALRLAVLTVVRDNGATSRDSIMAGLPAAGSDVKSNAKVQAAMDWLGKQELIARPVKQRLPYTVTAAGLAYLGSGGFEGPTVAGVVELARIVNEAREAEGGAA